MVRCLILAFVITVFADLRAQVLLYETFENVNTPYRATPFYKNQTLYCNGYIRGNTNIDCFGVAFANRVTIDITKRDGSGNFLFDGTSYPVNPSDPAGEVWGTLTPLAVKPNTQYSFSFYLGNVYPDNPAQIQPSVNGVAVGPAGSAVGFGNSSWQRFVYCWNSGSAVSADLSLQNLTQTAIGNDFVLDEIKFEVSPSNSSTQNINLCKGQSVQVGSNTYTKTGVYTDVFQGYNACDSVVVTRLTINNNGPYINNISQCNGTNYQIGSHIYSTAGSYLDTLTSVATNCDSIIATNLTFNKSFTLSNNINICNGNKYTVGQHSYFATGRYQDTLKTIKGGCDSIIATNLTVSNTPSTATNKVGICKGSKWTVGNHVYTAAGQYQDTLKSLISGCDSILKTIVQINPSVSIFHTDTICPGGFISVGSKKYFTSGKYLDTLKNLAGCDSIIGTNLTVANQKTFNQTILLGSNKIVLVGNKTYACNGVYKDTLKTSAGCDSIVTTTVKSETGSSQVWVPNIFSPNGDKNNDQILIFAKPNCVRRIIRWEIFDRWGEHVFSELDFQPNTETNGWNGLFNNAPLPQDHYAYFADVEYNDGTKETITGGFYLIR